ncbi:unnamed protein product, partial [Scytosiphon promiscuus]
RHCLPLTFPSQNYFYPDTPKNYQITQYDRPIAEHGEIVLPSGKRVSVSSSIRLEHVLPRFRPCDFVR